MNGFSWRLHQRHCSIQRKSSAVALAINACVAIMTAARGVKL